MNTILFELRGDYVALCDLLKLTGITTSGGEGKALVAMGVVKVDGQVESRKTAKIRIGQVVETQGLRVEIRSAEGTAD